MTPTMLIEVERTDAGGFTAKLVVKTVTGETKSLKSTYLGTTRTEAVLSALAAVVTSICSQRVRWEVVVPDLTALCLIRGAAIDEDTAVEQLKRQIA